MLLEPGGAYLVFRLLRGGNAEQALVRDGPWLLDRVDRLVNEVGGALVAAHGAGIVDRDVKPSNILFDDAGNAYLADFGIATVDGHGEDHDGPASAGSPLHVSPEQVRDGQSTAAPNVVVDPAGPTLGRPERRAHPAVRDHLVHPRSRQEAFVRLLGWHCCRSVGMASPWRQVPTTRWWGCHSTSGVRCPHSGRRAADLRPGGSAPASLVGPVDDSQPCRAGPPQRHRLIQLIEEVGPNQSS